MRDSNVKRGNDADEKRGSDADEKRGSYAVRNALKRIRIART
jgi:hypothetical protein